MTFPQDYAYAPGFDAADGDLVLVSEDLRPYTIPAMGTTIFPKSGLVNTFPVRLTTLDGAEDGGGMINNLIWGFAGFPIAALRYQITTYWAGGTVISVPMTIVTARNEIAGIWVKGNAWMILPTQNVDYFYDSGYAIPYQIRFGDFIQTS